MTILIDTIIKGGLGYVVIFFLSNIISFYLINKNFNNLINQTLLVNGAIFVGCNLLVDVLNKKILSKHKIVKDIQYADLLDNFIKNFIKTLLLFSGIHILSSLYNNKNILSPSWYRIILLILLVSSFTNILSRLLKLVIKNKYNDLIINIINKIITLFVLDFVPDIKIDTLFQDSVGYSIAKGVNYAVTSNFM